MIDFGNTALRFRVNIGSYEPINQSVWRLVSGHAHHRSYLPNIDIGLHQGQCFYIKNLNVSANHWECAGCQQRFTHHNNYERHVIERRCNGGKPKLVCNGGKFKHIMNSSEKFSMEEIQNSHGKLASGLRVSPSLVVGTSITQCVVMEGKGEWSLTKKYLGQWI